MVNYSLSANTIKHHHANIRMCLKTAVKNNIIPSNPSQLVDLPKVINSDINFYDIAEFIELLEKTRDERIFIVLLLSGTLGLRRSEVLGLTWQNLDFKNRQIKIAKKVYPVKGNSRVISDKMKNQTSYRVLVLPEQVFAFLSYRYSCIQKMCKSENYNKNTLTIYVSMV